MYTSPAAQELGQNHTVAELRDMIKVEFDKQAPTKLRKLEVAQYLVDLRNATLTATQRATVNEEAVAKYDPSVGEPKIFQGAMHEAFYADFVVGVDAELARLEKARQEKAHALAVREAGRIAWASKTAVVLVGGREVRGKVVDTVTREMPKHVRGGRVLLVIAHEGHPTRRTLHAYDETVFV